MQNIMKRCINKAVLIQLNKNKQDTFLIKDSH